MQKRDGFGETTRATVRGVKGSGRGFLGPTRLSRSMRELKDGWGLNKEGKPGTFLQR